MESRTQAKAKDPKKFRGQGQTLSRPRPRTKDTDASVLQKKGLEKIFSSDLKKKGLQKIFYAKKGLHKIFFRRFPLEENKKRPSQIFYEVSGAFQQNFDGSKNSAVLEPRTGQFSRT